MFFLNHSVYQSGFTILLYWGNKHRQCLTVLEQQACKSQSYYIPSAGSESSFDSALCVFFVPEPRLKNSPDFRYIILMRASLMAQMVKNLPAMWETWVRSLGGEDPLEKRMATHSSILAWRILWTEEPGGLQSVGSHRVDMTEWLTFSLLFSWER